MDVEETAILRRTIENNLADAENALLLLPPGMSSLRDYITNIRFNCKHALESLDNGSMKEVNLEGS